MASLVSYMYLSCKSFLAMSSSHCATASKRRLISSIECGIVFCCLFLCQFYNSEAVQLSYCWAISSCSWSESKSTQRWHQSTAGAGSGTISSFPFIVSTLESVVTISSSLPIPATLGVFPTPFQLPGPWAPPLLAPVPLQPSPRTGPNPNVIASSSNLL